MCSTLITAPITYITFKGEILYESPQYLELAWDPAAVTNWHCRLRAKCRVVPRFTTIWGWREGGCLMKMSVTE